jgi:diguanylate cyclase (GGDEF)-like protein/PAS domain S-box-containing protein
MKIIGMRSLISVSFWFILIVALAIILQPVAITIDYIQTHNSDKYCYLWEVLFGSFLFFITYLITFVALRFRSDDLKQFNKPKQVVNNTLPNRKLTELRANTRHTNLLKQYQLEIGNQELVDTIKRLLEIYKDKEGLLASHMSRCYQHLINLTDASTPEYGSAVHCSSDTKSESLSKCTAQRIIDSTPIGVMVVDSEHHVEYINASFELITGYSSAEILGQSPSILKSGYHDQNFYEQMNQALAEEGQWQGEIRNRRKNGDVFIEWLSISVLKNALGVVTKKIGMFSEVTAQQHVREKLHSLAYYDPLTLLANRTLFIDKLEHLIKKNSSRTLCVIFIDLDGFKRVNDSLGHHVGDQLLKTFAKRLKKSIRECDIAARWGGDEFIVAIEVADETKGVLHFCNKQLNLLRIPFKLNDRELNVTASIGVSIYDNAALTATDMIRNADIAMYQAKKLGKNRYEIFSSHMHQDITEKIEIESKLRTAITQRRIEVYFQPQISGHKNNIIGFEALARWHDSELGNIAPLKFLAVAESTSLISQLGALIIDKSLEKFKPLHHANPNVSLSVNLSASQLQDERLIEFIERKVTKYSINSKQVKLEITEDIFISNIEKSIRITSQLKQLGFQISLDDFGTGYSSLSYLKDFDIDELKIDQSFVSDITASPRNQAIVSAMLAMAKILSIDCIVEGVETEQQLAQLQKIGCKLFQGYLFYRPLSIDEVHKISQLNAIPNT